MRITTCVPEQKRTILEKLIFIGQTLKTERPDIFVLPQEYFGGWLCEKIAVKREEILPTLLQLSKDYNSAIIVGVVEDEKERYQKLWFIDEGKFIGEIIKFANPSYDIKDVGTHGLTSLTDLTSRFQTFKIKGINVAGFFCWECFSDFLMAGLELLEPDLVISAIKFGIAGYPKLELKNGLKQIVGVNYCGGDIWFERLKFCSKFEVKCPIACSTNSWNVSSKYEPLAGVMYAYDNLEPSKEINITKTEEINFEHIRGLRENKFSYVERNDKFPDYKYGDLTMMMKIHRMEQRLLGETLQEGYYKSLKKIRRQKKRLNKI